MFFGGTYDHCAVSEEAIKHPYNCNLGKPLKKWYVVVHGRCQGICALGERLSVVSFALRMQSHESFRRQVDAKVWLAREVENFGRHRVCIGKM